MKKKKTKKAVSKTKKEKAYLVINFESGDVKFNGSLLNLIEAEQILKKVAVEYLARNGNK